MSRILLFVAMLSSVPVYAQNAALDRRFGGDGLVSLREPTASNARNLGLAACAGPGNLLTIVSATAPNQLAMFRLKADGSLDTGFSGDGIAVITVPESSGDIAQGACMADGRIVISRMAPGMGADKNIHVMRVLSSGEFDLSFGDAGTRVLDFDNYEPGLGDMEVSQGLNLIAGDDILVTTRTFVNATDSRAGIARIAANGAIKFARLVTTTGLTSIYASGAGIGPDGRIWAVGGGNPNGVAYNTWFRVELDANTGAMLETFVGAEGNYVVDSGRVLANGIMVAVGKYVPQAEPGGAYRPRLLVFRETGTSALPLPALIPVNNFAPSLAPYPGHSVVIPTTDGRVLVSAPMGGQNGEFEIATYVAQAELGASAAQDRVDTRFGNGGAYQFAFHAAAPCANSSPPVQRMIRASNWLGAPVLVGIHATSCPPSLNNTMVAKLLTGNDVFLDGLE